MYNLLLKIISSLITLTRKMATTSRVNIYVCTQSKELRAPTAVDDWSVKSNFIFYTSIEIYHIESGRDKNISLN